MFFARSFNLIYILLAITFSDAWYIDEDCQGSKREFIERALDNAFQLNNYARAGFGAPNPEQQQLIEWLFGTNGETHERLGHKLEFINAVNRRNQPKTEVGQDDFVVHCTLDRIQERTGELEEGETRYYDPELGQNLSIKDKLLDCKTAVAYVMYPKPDDEGSFVASHYNILQVCPWFLDYVMRRDPQFQNDIDKSLAMKIVEKIGEWIVRTKYTAVDMQSLFDKVLLHEISHTSGAGRTYDVGGFSGYGWKNCRKLSTVVTVFPDESAENQEPKTKGPEQNADSIALLGATHRMLIDGATIQEDGNFVTRAAERLKRMIAGFRIRSPLR